jgi:hypothetical protein
LTDTRYFPALVYRQVQFASSRSSDVFQDKEPRVVSLLRNHLFLTPLVLAAAGAGAIACWALVDTIFHATGDYEFCTGCHAYAPIAAALPGRHPRRQYGKPVCQLP